jgi:methionyl-tRNA synthetase
MSDKTPFYITTAIAYANGAPHIGHAFEFALADAIARSEKNAHDIYFVTGMDEHGQKIEGRAKEAGVSLQEFVDGYAKKFQELDRELGVEYDFFVRTSDRELHYKGAQALWNKLAGKGDLEKRTYSALYCVGCEEFKTEKDLNEKGECPIHLTKPEVVQEENWFFKLSKYTDEIKKRIESDELKIHPETRKNEIMALLERGLDDVSFSRPISKVSWGIPVPNDDTQVMYVWCDALSNYITAIGYGTDNFKEELWNNATHVIGEDILRFHAAIWPAMLLSADLPLPKKILVHGHITSGGQKMSKTLGNVIDPIEVIEMFRPVAGELAGEAARFILLHEVPSFEDGDITMGSIKTAYTAYLANGIGNLTSRVMKMATANGVTLAQPKTISYAEGSYEINTMLHTHMDRLRSLDEYIATNEPFKAIKTDEAKGKEMLQHCLSELDLLAQELAPFAPKTSALVLTCTRENKMPEKPLFARLP